MSTGCIIEESEEEKKECIAREEYSEKIDDNWDNIENISATLSSALDYADNILDFDEKGVALSYAVAKFIFLNIKHGGSQEYLDYFVKMTKGAMDIMYNTEDEIIADEMIEGEDAEEN